MKCSMVVILNLDSIVSAILEDRGVWIWWWIGSCRGKILFNCLLERVVAWKIAKLTLSRDVIAYEKVMFGPLTLEGSFISIHAPSTSIPVAGS